MFSRLFGICAMCAFTAKAMIIPAGVAPDTSAEENNVFKSIVDPKSQRIQLPCPTCTFSRDFEDIDDSDDAQNQRESNDIVLDFNISDDGDRLELNGRPIYPPVFHSDALFHGTPLYAIQVPAAGSEDYEADTARRLPLEITSSGLRIETDHIVSEEGDVVVPIKYQIMSLEGKPMQLDEISVDLLKMSDGELLILKTDNTPSTDFSSFSAPLIDAEECGSLPPTLCRLKNLLKSKMSGLRTGHSSQPESCADRHGSVAWLRPHIDTSVLDEVELEGDSQKLDMRPFDKYHRGRNRHHFFRAFLRGLIAVLIPIMAGITVGLSVSFFGLVVGRLIGYIWLKLGRGGQRGYEQLDTESVAEKGKILPVEEESDGPPTYEQVPPYEETQKPGC